MEYILDRKERLCLKGIIDLVASFWRDAVRPAPPLDLPEAKVRIAAQCPASSAPLPPDLIGSGRSRTEEQ